MNSGSNLPAKTGDSINVPPIDTTTPPSPPQPSSPTSTACEQGSDRASQQDSSNTNHSTFTSTTTTIQEIHLLFCRCHSLKMTSHFLYFKQP
jgi:hypothetical protein